VSLTRFVIVSNMNDTTRSIPVAEGESQNDETKPKREKSTLTKVLPTERISLDRQPDILRAYAAIYEANGGNPVSNEEAGSTLTPKFSGSTLTQAVPFFTDVGLITRTDTGFVPSAELVAYNKARQWDEKTAKDKLRSLFEKTWFYRCLVPRLQLGPQPVENCLGVFADESNAGKDHTQRLNGLLFYLELAGIISSDGSKVTLTEPKTGPAGKEITNGTTPLKDDPEAHTLYLDRTKTRKVTVTAPLEISQAEYKRLCDWLRVALIIGDEQK
jgi:hypothetical protein